MSTSQNNYSNHNYFMKLALDQANKVLGLTKKNPAVGCVIVKNNNVISVGSTSINGRPHAEDNAINFCSSNLKNSNLYVTLEPCCHFGKTSPCVNKIIKKKIKRVFFSIKDPDNRTFNKSIKILNEKGILANSGILDDKIKHFYRSYLKSKKEDLPFVTCKLAASKDFYTVNKNEDKWITNKYSRGRVHLMRSNHDCIMTSSKTIAKDNPSLTCRIDGLFNRSPSRIILDSKLKISINSTIAKEAHKYKTIVFFNKYNKSKIKLLKRLKLKIYKVNLDKYGNLDLKESLIKAKRLGFTRIFLEAGLTLSTAFLKRNLVDDFKLFISNKKLGRKGEKSVKKYLTLNFRKKRKIIDKINLLGDNLITYKLK